VLFVLLYEITTLYARVLRAVLAQRREREARMMTGNAVSASIAHEIKQPLAGMVTNADAGLLWLDRTTPDLDEARAAFSRSLQTAIGPQPLSKAFARPSKMMLGARPRWISMSSSWKPSPWCVASY
jgi:signal transduction histidine kinase